MAKKYILVNDKLKASPDVSFHYQLIPSGSISSDVKGGGWYEHDFEKREITLYGLSSDFGPVVKDHLIKIIKSQQIPRAWLGCKFFYTHYDYRAHGGDLTTVFENREQICL